MATSVGWATLQVIPSAKNFGKNVTNQTRPGMVAAGKSGGKSFGSGMIAASKSLVAPIAAIFAGTAIKGFFQEAVQGAAEYQTATKVTARAFGDSANQILKWAGDSRKSFAFTETEALKLANNLAFVASQAGGLAGKELTNFTKKSLEVAQALAVMNDIPVERTMEAMQMAAAGYTTRLKNLGYNIDESIIKQKALAMGAKETDGEISKQARTQALLAVVLEQSQGPLKGMADAQGDATAQALLAKRRWDDLKGTIGNALLPVFNTALKAINEWIPALNKWVSNLLSGKGAAGEFGSSIKDGLGAAIKFVKPILAAMVPVVDAVKNAYQTVWPAIQRAASAIWDVLGPGLKQIRALIVNDVLPSLKSFVDAIAPIVSWLVDKLGPVVALVFGEIVKLIKGALNIITGVLKVFTGVFTGDWNKVWNGVKQIFQGIWQVIQVWFLKKIALIGKIGIKGIKLLRNAIGNGLKWIRGRWNAAWSWVANKLRSVWSRIWGWIKSFIGRITSAIGSFLSRVKSRWDRGWQAIGNVLRNAWKRFSKTISNRIRDIIRFFRRLPGRIKSALGNLGKLLLSAGKDLIRGLGNGIKAMGGWIRKKATDVVKGAVNAAKSALRISSPSKVFHQIGKYTAEGLANGMTDGSGMVAEAARSMTAATMTGGSPTTRAARPWNSHQGDFGGVSGGIVYNFNARTVDVDERTIHPLLRRAEARQRVGLIR